jgi:DNA replication initiation complex subunit (GINS family)
MRDFLVFWMTLVGTACWVFCFWWMHRISATQHALLQTLYEQGKRIEKLSKVEHDLIKEVHPQVNDIKAGVEEMIGVAKEIQEDNSASAKNSAKDAKEPKGRGPKPSKAIV